MAVDGIYLNDVAYTVITFPRSHGKRFIFIYSSYLDTMLLEIEISEKKEMSNLSLSQWYSLLYEKRLKDVKLDKDMTLDILNRQLQRKITPMTVKVL